MRNCLFFLLISCFGFSASHAEAQSQNAGFIHVVYFWLKEGTTSAQRTEMVKQLKSLRELKVVRKLSIGGPANTPRPVVDNSYDIALIVEFRDRAAQDSYLVSQKHLDVVAAIDGYIQKMQVYDTILE